MAATNKQRQPRLRASCDGCFLAKVKCSKARPICSRCLTCGTECRYSPSSRAGKPKASETARHHRQAAADLRAPTPVTSEGMVYAINPGMTGVYKLEQGWSTPSTGIEGTLSRNPSVSSGLTFMDVDNAAATSMPGDVYGPTMPWTPPNDIPAAFTKSPLVGNLANGHGRAQSYDIGNGAMGWVESSSPEMFPFNQVSTPPTMNSTYFPSPTATPNIRPVPPRPKSTQVNSTCGSCTCFTVCLQSLQALHNASTPVTPPFDLVLSLNRKAVEGCAAMLACARCMRGSGTHTAAMLLATVLGTITAFYKNASQSYFDQGGVMAGDSTATTISTPPTMASVAAAPGLGVSLGAYTVNGEDSRWLELEILARELRKLDEVYSTFRDVCTELSEDPEVSKAMIGYLGKGLTSTIQVVSHRKGDMSYS